LFFLQHLQEARFLRHFAKTKNPVFAGFDQIVLAEKEGFEPPEPWLQFNGFQDRRIRPLCHFSLLVNFISFLLFSGPPLPIAIGTTALPFLRRKDNIFLFLENFFEKIA
jgi:hypothetical protein